MAVTRVQHVTQAASEGLNAKFSDLCDPHDLSSVRASKRTISKQSRASSKAHNRQLQERRLSAAADDDAFLMSFIPVKSTTEPSLFRLRRSISFSSMGLQYSPRNYSGHRVTKRLLRLCMGSGANKYGREPYADCGCFKIEKIFIHCRGRSITELHRCKEALYMQE